MRLFVAMLSGGNDAPNSDQLRGLGKAIAQMKRLARAIASADQIITQHLVKQNVASYQSVFIAPEYFFSNQRWQNDRFFKHEVKQWIVSGLSVFARRYPRLLIIPGTILWTKKAQKGETKDVDRINKIKGRMNKSTQFDKSAQPALESNYKGTGYDGIVGGILAGQRKKTGWAHAGKYGSDSGGTEWDDKLSMPNYYLDKEPDTLIAQNVAYVCKGDRILKYAKVGNSAEVASETKNLVFAPGSLAGRFRVGDVQYGLEICMDHWIGVLKHSSSGPVHIHLITSSQTDNRPFHYTASDGGVVMHSSTGSSGGIFPGVLLGNNSQAPKFVESIQGPDNLTVYVIDLDDKVCGLSKVSPDDPLESVVGGSEDALLDSTLAPVAHVHDLFDGALFDEMMTLTDF